MKPLRNSIILLSLLLALFSATYWVGKAKSNAALAEISLNLASVALGIIATTWLIDRIINDNAIKERDRLRRIAYEHLKTVLQNHLIFLQRAYKASKPAQPNPLPSSTKEFFGEDFFEALRKLDFNGKAPVTPERSWATYMSQECNHLSESIRQTVDRYVTVFYSEEIRKLDRLADSGLVSFAKHLPTIEAQTKANGRRLGNMFNGARTLLADHIAAFTTIVSIANSSISPLDPVGPSREVWADNISPRFGDSFFADEG